MTHHIAQLASQLAKAETTAAGLSRDTFPATEWEYLQQAMQLCPELITELLHSAPIALEKRIKTLRTSLVEAIAQDKAL